MSAACTKQAIEAVEEKGIDTDIELFHMIEHQPGESIYTLAKLMRWSTGKTYAAARRLEKAGMVHIEKAARNGREVLVIKPKTWQEYFAAEELEEMRRPEFMNEVEAIVKSGR